MHQIIVFWIVAHKIIMPAGPDQRIGVHAEILLLQLYLHLAGERAPRILEPDLPPGLNSLIQNFNRIINFLIGALDAVVDIDLPLQPGGLPAAHEAFQLLDELRRFFGCDKGGRLHSIQQQPHLCRFKGARGEKIAGFGCAGMQDIEAEAFEQLDISINRFALCGHAAFFELSTELLRGERVLLIRLFLKNLKKIQRFQLCICTACQVGSLQFLMSDRGGPKAPALSMMPKGEKARRAAPSPAPQ